MNILSFNIIFQSCVTIYGYVYGYYSKSSKADVTFVQPCVSKMMVTPRGEEERDR